MQTKITEDNQEFIEYMMTKIMEDYFELIQGFSLLDAVSILGGVVKGVFDRIDGTDKEKLVEAFLKSLKQELLRRE